MRDKELTPMNMTIDRNPWNEQVFKMKYSNTMNYIDIVKEMFYHYDSEKLGFMNDYANYTEFIGSANATKLFQVDRWQIGVTGINPIYINARADK